MGNCSSAPRLKANLRAFIAANPPTDGYGDDWYFDTMNVLLDRWAYSHVQFLRKRFLEATGDRGEKELDKKGFFKLFGELQDMPKAVAESAFRMFDTDNSGKLNFREFCCALALCCHLMSSDDEKIRFVFDMFDTNDDGLLGSNDVQLLLEYALQREEAKDTVDDPASVLRRQQRIAEMKQELLGSSQHLAFERFYEWATRNLESLNNLLHTFQIVPSPDRERSICEEILSRHQSLQEGSTWYCISHKWLQVWKAHAGWTGPAPGRRITAPRLSPAGEAFAANALRDRSLSSDVYPFSEDASLEECIYPFEVGGHHMVTRPPEIDNSDLEGEHKGELKMNLVEHLDYELIPEEMWLKLVEWYGGGPAILRKVICMGQDQQAQVELYPPLVLVVVAGESGQPLPQFSRRFFISRQSSLEEVLGMLAEKLSRPADRSRLWHRTKGEQWRLVQQMAVTLEEFLEGKVWDAGAFLLETMTASNEWPRDAATTPEPAAADAPTVSAILTDRDLTRHFEVGDRVEAQSGVTNQWMRGTIVDVIQRDHSTAPSQVKVHYDSTVYKCDEWISTFSDRLAPLDTHTSAEKANTTQASSSEGLPPVRGATGLQNLGNTCFLNATVQCLANTPLLREYFLSSQYLKDVNERGSGCKGRLAEEFGHVMGDLWAGKNAALTPRNLKRTIDQFAPHFAGYEQHDAQELLAFLMDGLHEDLNRCAPGSGTGSRSGSSARRDSNTPKLFLRTKPLRGGSATTRLESPKRNRGFRERSGDLTAQSSKDSFSDTGPYAAGAAFSDVPREPTMPEPPAQESGCSSVSTVEVQAASVLPSTTLSSSPFGREPAVEDSPADPHLPEGTGDRLEAAKAGANELSTPNDEAPGTLERLVQPTMLWSRARSGMGGRSITVTSEETGAVVVSRPPERHVGDEVPNQDEAMAPKAPATGMPGVRGARVGKEDPALRVVDAGHEDPVTEFTEALDAPSSNSSLKTGSAAAATKSDPRKAPLTDESEKRPGTSRWWSFAWRRGRGALDLPKDASSGDAAREAPSGGMGSVFSCDASNVGPCNVEAVAVGQAGAGDDMSQPPASADMSSSPEPAGTLVEFLRPTEQCPVPAPGDEQREAAALLEEVRARPPAGAAGAAVAAARVSAEASDDGLSMNTFNESEDFVPELLTPQRPPFRRSLSLFSLINRRRKPEEEGPSSPKRRPRTPPTMMPLREEREQSDSSPERHVAEREDTQDGGAETLASATTVVTEAQLAQSGPARSFLPWSSRGKRPPQANIREEPPPRSREGSREPGDEADRAASREGGRSGRAKDKETFSLPSFLRRSKSRESSAHRRARPSGHRPPPAPHQGDMPIADPVATTTPAETEATGDSAPEASIIEPEHTDERPVRSAGSSLAFPFLRAPWKRDPPRGTSPHSKPGVREGDQDEYSDEYSEDKGPGRRMAEVTRDASSTSASSSKEAKVEGKEKDALLGAGPGGLPQSKEASQATGLEDRDNTEGTEEPPEVDEDHLPDDEKAARQWERYRARNRSLIVDVFEGQLRSQLTCCRCGATSSTFEPFRYLSVPIPSNHVDRACLRVIFFPLPFSRSKGDERQPLARYSVTVPKSSTVQRVEKALSSRLPVPMTSVLLAEVYRSRIHRYLDSSLQLSDVRAEDQLFAFEVLQTPEELLQYQELHAPCKRSKERIEEPKKQPQARVLFIQAMHRRVVDVCRSDGRTWAQRREVFGLPFVMSAASSWSYATLHDMLMLHARRFLRPPRKDLQRRDPASSSSSPEERQVPFVARIVNASGTACGACDRRNCTGCLLPKGSARLRLRAGLLTGAVSTAKIYLALDWVDSAVYDQEYIDSVVDDVSVARASAETQDPDGPESAASEGSGTVPISACIEAFAQPEEMKVENGNGVMCEKCNEVVDAVKKLEVWREPDVLILHIKRFHFSGVHYEKLNTPVEVPWKELNLRPWIVGPTASGMVSYELYGVACHWGGMSGGHYTSFCINSEGKEQVWLKFNDESVTSVSFSQELDDISRQCYVLFYRKRAFSSSNLINYSSL